VTDDLSSELLSVVARLNRWATRNAQVSAPIAGLRLLAALEEEGPSRIGDLARLDNCSQPTITTQVQRLQEAGWIARAADATDARAVRVSLSPAGRVELERARRARASVVQPALDGLSAHQRATLREATTILDRLMADHGAAARTVTTGRGSVKPSQAVRPAGAQN
jgi:DNA-binding MarR family transcriptional regulator